MQRSWKRWAWIGFAIVAVVFVFFSYQTAQSPAKSAQEQAVAIAKKKAGLKTKTGFYWYNRDQTYFTVAGTNQKNTPVYVLIHKKNGAINVYKQSAGISRNDALTKVWNHQNPKKVLNINFGLYKNRPVWQVAYVKKNGSLNYDTIDFKTGETTQLIQNL
ncbi:DUF5590 domain-containing protein [Lactobacillus selangorensis]|uniref:Peptidase propeptide and ypeb domain-containing protein n=1 Tax=Lactobacillus selangorensis TaxID=81857 RepID=A0A0R2G366_9LACO|nr:DUF5590 domain-containing protein [Lactobacillus selangorensis]KRN33974.1 peptidase propeptide and ypeb domain-containing protein [Lactobacillus selangorensis]